MSACGLYARVTLCAFRRQATYRVATASGAFTNTVFGFLKVYVLIALWHARPSLGGYDVADAIAYCFIAQGMLEPVRVFGGSLELSERIRTGDVAVDLYRPADLQAWWLADELGRATFATLFRGGPPVLAGFIAFDLDVPAPARCAAAAVALVLAVLVSFALRYIVSLSVFWLRDDRGINTISLVTTMFFAGMILPLVAFPGRLGTLAGALPWAALIQVPADVLLGKRADLASAYAFQLGWAVVLLAAGRLLTAAARRRLVIHGG